MEKELFTDEFKMMVAQYVLEGHTRREVWGILYYDRKMGESV